MARRGMRSASTNTTANSSRSDWCHPDRKCHRGNFFLRVCVCVCREFHPAVDSDKGGYWGKMVHSAKFLRQLGGNVAHAHTSTGSFILTMMALLSLLSEFFDLFSIKCKRMDLKNTVFPTECYNVVVWLFKNYVSVAKMYIVANYKVSKHIENARRLIWAKNWDS